MCYLARLKNRFRGNVLKLGGRHSSVSMVVWQCDYWDIHEISDMNVISWMTEPESSRRFGNIILVHYTVALVVGWIVFY